MSCAVDPKALLKEIVGTDGEFGADDITELLRSIIATSFADLLAKLQVPALDLAAKYRELSESLRLEVCERIDDEYGLECPQLFIVNISLPEAVEKALDTRTSMGVIGDMQRYQQYQMGTAMTMAADNPGGGAAEGMGLGVGMAMATQMMPGMARSGTAAPPPPPVSAAWHVAVAGQTQGPFSPEQIAGMIAAGRLQGTAMVWSRWHVGLVTCCTSSPVGALLRCRNTSPAAASALATRMWRRLPACKSRIPPSTAT